MTDDLLTYIKDRNDQDHAEIKQDIKFIKDIIAPRVASHGTAIKIILMIIAGAGLFKAFGWM